MDHSGVTDALIVPKFHSFENYGILEIQRLVPIPYPARHARVFSIANWNSHKTVQLPDLLRVFYMSDTAKSWRYRYAS